MTSHLSLPIPAGTSNSVSSTTDLAKLIQEVNGLGKTFLDNREKDIVEKIFEHMENEIELIIESVCQRIDTDCEKLINESYKVQEYILTREKRYTSKSCKFKCHWFLFRLKNTFTIPFEMHMSQRDLQLYYSSELERDEIVSVTPRLHFKDDKATLSVCARYGTRNYKRFSEYSAAPNSCNTVKRICTKCYWARGLYNVSEYLDWQDLYD